jgi:regulator of telomere elongation helicase 1
MQGGRASHHRLHALSDALRIAFRHGPPRRLRCHCVRDNVRRSEADKTLDAYRVHIQPGDKRTGGPCLSFWCMVPGVTMRELQAEGVKSIVLTSGTLSPMESFAHELVRRSRAPAHLFPV